MRCRRKKKKTCGSDGQKLTAAWECGGGGWCESGGDGGGGFGFEGCDE